MEDKEKRRNFVNNIEFIPYIPLDNSQKIMINDFVKDYDELQQELSIANDKLKKIEEYCESIKEKYKYYNECNTTDVRVILKIIEGND